MHCWPLLVLNCAEGHSLPHPLSLLHSELIHLCDINVCSDQQKRNRHNGSCRLWCSCWSMSGAARRCLLTGYFSSCQSGCYCKTLAEDSGFFLSAKEDSLSPSAHEVLTQIMAHMLVMLLSASLKLELPPSEVLLKGKYLLPDLALWAFDHLMYFFPAVGVYIHFRGAGRGESPGVWLGDCADGLLSLIAAPFIRFHHIAAARLPLPHSCFSFSLSPDWLIAEGWHLLAGRGDQRSWLHYQVSWMWSRVDGCRALFFFKLSEASALGVNLPWSWHTEMCVLELEEHHVIVPSVKLAFQCADDCNI